MKHTLSTTFRRALALTLMLLMIASLGGCWKKDDADSTEPESTPPSSEAPIETTTEAPIETTTEAPTIEMPTEAPTETPTTAPNLEGIKGTVTAPTLKIRKGAGSEYQSIGTYSKGDQVELIEIVGEWGKTDKGWVSLDYIQISGTTSNPEKDNEKENDKPTTNADIVSDGKTKALGYGVVNLGTLNVRSGPGTKHDDIGDVTLGNRYAYYQKSGNWVRIKDGWVSTSYFYIEGGTGDGAGTGTITTDLNVRSGPSKNFDRVGGFKKGETVRILTQINKWGYTSKGWVSMKYVTMDGTVSAGSKGKGTITADVLNIRKTGSNTAEKIGKYNKNDVVEILEVKDGWGKTDKGWISMAYVNMDESTITSTYKTGKGTVTASSLHIRAKADKTSESLGAYVKDEKVEILEVNGEWGKTDKGWISLKYVKMD